MTGQAVTHYRVGDKLGEGGSATVYHAEDLALGREVVIKFFSSEGAASLARFQHEARTISSLNHPNICTIYEIGEHDGRPFLAMEKLDGQALSEAIGRSPLPIDRLLDLGTQIADALDAAHAAGIVHRDVKPANMFLTRSGRIKLLDFGVAVMLPRRVDPTTARSLFSTGGTIPYMSPEQARVEDLDHRTDLFSVGIVLYEMATARRPFSGATASAVLEAIVNQPVIPPGAHNSAVPAELERIITKALEKNPALRYQTASDLRADLQRLKRDLDLARSVPTQAAGHARGRLAPLSSRWWRTVAAAGAVAMVGSGWLATAAVRARWGSLASTTAVSLPASGADVELTSEIVRPPVAPAQPPAQPAPPSAAAARPPVEPAPSAAATRPPIEPAPSAPPPPAGADQFRIARQQIELKLYDQAIDTLRKVAEGGHRPDAVEASFLMASVHEARGDSANAMSTYIEIANRFPRDSRAAEALLRLAESTLKSRRPDREQDARRTLTTLVQTYPASAWAPRALLMRGDIEARQGTFQRDEVVGGAVPTAASTYREVVERYASSDAASAALGQLAHIYAEAKRFELAAATLEQLATRDPDDPSDAWFAAAEIYEKRLKDHARASAAYLRVPPSSSHAAEARKRLSR